VAPNSNPKMAAIAPIVTIERNLVLIGISNSFRLDELRLPTWEQADD
jgi:hypothetical protein